MKQVLLKMTFVCLCVALLVTCKKDYSVETGNANINATGTLLDSAGSCQNIAVSGKYIVDTTLTDSNYISVQVTFTNSGRYKIETDTVNGFWFIDSGYVFSAGAQTIKVRGYGKPLLPVNPTFIASLNNTYCFFVVPIKDATNGTTPAFGSYSLEGAPGSCTGAVVSGTYTAGKALTAVNTATVQVTVTTPGGYSISTTTANGMLFKRNGIFDNAGSYAVTLYGSGTPVDTGTTVMPLTAGTSLCSFPVHVVAGTTTGGNSGGGGTITGNNNWQFTAGGKTITGTFPTGNATLVSTTQSGLSYTILNLNGKSAGDSVLQISLFLINNSGLKTGTYLTSAANTTNSVIFDFTDASGGAVYHADNTDLTNVITLVITSYDASTKIVKGTFSGNAGLNGSTTSAAITSGAFTATIQ